MKEPFKIKIEHGIPITPKACRSEITAAMKSMKVGDSFLYPLDRRGNIACCAIRLGMKTATRKDGNGMVRVWRVK